MGRWHRFALAALVPALALSICRGAAVTEDTPSKLAEIRRLLESGDWQRAGELAAALCSRNGAPYEAFELLGRARDAAKDFAGADAAYQSAIRLAPEAAGPHVSLGVSYVQRGQPDRAMEQFREALTRDPRNVAALSNAGSLELSAGHFAEAENYYNVASEVVPNDPVTLLGLATAALGAGHRDMALASASQLSAAASPPIHFSLGVLFARFSMYPEAAAEFESLVRRGVRSQELFLSLGRVYSQQERFDAAKESYFKAIDLNPNDAAPYIRVGADYLAQHKSSFALAWLFRAVNLDRSQPEALFLLGRALMEGEYFETAHKYLDEYTRLRPKDPKGWLLLGDAFVEDEQLENALAAYRGALQLVPQLAAAHYLVGNAAYLTKHLPEAKRELLRALEIDPSHAEALLRLGEIAYHENDDEEAARRFLAILSAHPEHAEAAYDMAKVRIRQQRFEEARARLETIVAAHPDDIRFHYLLGQVYRQVGATELSARELELYRTLKAGQEYEHRFVRHSHAYVE
jgi:tetratricopeptide (TPR) repeat protein